MLHQLMRVTPEKAMKLTCHDMECHLIMKEEGTPTLQGRYYWQMYAYESVCVCTCVHMHVCMCACVSACA